MPRRAGRDHPPVELDGVTLTHPRKVLWPDVGVTKLELAEYYRVVAPYLVPFMRDRALTLRPYPRGIEAPGYYVQDAPKGLPEWVRTWADVATSVGRTVEHIVGGDERTLLWLAQYNAIEVHTWLSRIDRPDEPDFAVVDLDPSEATPFEHVAQAARLFKAAFDRAGVRGFPKVTGSSGIHVYVPLVRGPGFNVVRASMHALCLQIEAAALKLVTTDPTIADRGDRVFLDYAQNSRGRTTVAPYSVRPKPGAPVAAPIRWEELDDPELRPNRWSIRDMAARLDAVGDLAGRMLECRQRLPETWN